MAYNKVVYNNSTLIDLTRDTVTADKLLSGYTAHDKSGASITGTYTPVSGDTLFVGEKTVGSSNATSISFTGLPAQPKAFAVIKVGDLASASTRYILDIWYTSEIGVRNHTMYKSGSTTTVYTYMTMTYTYSNGTLTIKTASTSNTGYFKGSATHRLIAIC